MPDTVRDARDVQTVPDPLTPALGSHDLHPNKGSLH